jgi:hypothetical protein
MFVQLDDLLRMAWFLSSAMEECRQGAASGRAGSAPPRSPTDPGTHARQPAAGSAHGAPLHRGRTPAPNDCAPLPTDTEEGCDAAPASANALLAHPGTALVDTEDALAPREGSLAACGVGGSAALQQADEPERASAVFAQEHACISFARDRAFTSFTRRAVRPSELFAGRTGAAVEAPAPSVLASGRRRFAPHLWAHSACPDDGLPGSASPCAASADVFDTKVRTACRRWRALQSALLHAGVGHYRRHHWRPTWRCSCMSTTLGVPGGTCDPHGDWPNEGAGGVPGRALCSGG